MMELMRWASMVLAFCVAGAILSGEGLRAIVRLTDGISFTADILSFKKGRLKVLTGEGETVIPSRKIAKIIFVRELEAPGSGVEPPEKPPERESRVPDNNVVERLNRALNKLIETRDKDAFVKDILAVKKDYKSTPATREQIRRLRIEIWQRRLPIRKKRSTAVLALLYALEGNYVEAEALLKARRVPVSRPPGAGARLERLIHSSIAFAIGALKEAYPP